MMTSASFRRKKDNKQPFSGFCADWPASQRGGGLLTLIRDDRVFQNTGVDYRPPLKRTQVQLSSRKWAEIPFKAKTWAHKHKRWDVSYVEFIWFRKLNND